MNFDSVFFLACVLPVFALLYALIPGIRVKNYLLLAAGLLFYCFEGIEGLPVLLAAAVLNYVLSLAARRTGRSRLFAAVAVAADLCCLLCYKYLDFFLLSLPGLAPGRWTGLGLSAPLGLSFFLFKCISYQIDACREPDCGADSLFEFLSYIFFFPQLLAGPIARFRDFAPQLAKRRLTLASAAAGLRRFIVGLSKKLLLAAAAARICDRVFALPGDGLDFRLAWLGAIAYTLQIYSDFSGYSDMAIGLGRCLGFSTAENFDYPYTAASIGDFWRRWHISLSSWFRDYVYIPLGGNRRGAARTALNKLLVFALCGLWHGAAWTFVLWGLWHGLLSAVESLLRGAGVRGRGAGLVLGHVYVCLAVCLGFVMFRAESVAQGLGMLTAMFRIAPAGTAQTAVLRMLATPAQLALLAGAALLCLPLHRLFRGADGALYPWADALGYAAGFCLLVLCLMAASAGGYTPFIYAQF